MYIQDGLSLANCLQEDTGTYGYESGELMVNLVVQLSSRG